MTKILVAEDDPLTIAGIEILLDRTNFEIVATVRSGSAALDAIASVRPDMLVLDNGMPERTGLDVLRIGTGATSARSYS